MRVKLAVFELVRDMDGDDVRDNSEDSDALADEDWLEDRDADGERDADKDGVPTCEPVHS